MVGNIRSYFAHMERSFGNEGRVVAINVAVIGSEEEVVMVLVLVPI